MPRRIARLFVVLLFTISIGVHGLATPAAAKVATPHAQSQMLSLGEPMDCPGHEEMDQANCVAACSGLIGILLEPTALAPIQSRRTPPNERFASLSDRTIPPEPYPPRPSALI